MAEDKKGSIFDVFSKSFFERFHSGPRKELGYVKDVTENQNGVFVDLVNEYGAPATFVFVPKAERFKDAPEGFAVGDVIEMNTSGARILSARPLKLNLNEKAEITAKFKALGEEA